MDDTPTDQLLHQLTEADPAEAPDLADEISTRLAAELDTDHEDPPADQA